MPRKTFLILILIIISLTQAAFRLPGGRQAPSRMPNGYDLIAAVNAYRAVNGYYALNPDGNVMAAAQSHADWIAANPASGGHIGVGGSDETVRVGWTGYGGGASIQCDENWASGTSIDQVMASAWSDWTHQEVMLNGWGNRYTDIGGGVADEGNGLYVFVLDVCKVIGQEMAGVTPGVPSAGAAGTPDLSNYIFGVSLATPAADGSVTHVVQYGQTLVKISEAYGIPLAELRSLNGMAADETMIRVDQKLVIKPPSGTPQATGTETAGATGTPLVTYTSRPLTRTAIPTLALSGVPIQIEATEAGSQGGTGGSQTAGMILVIAFGAALIAFVYFFFLRS